MADWRKLCIELTLADGKIDQKEVTILRKALYADQKIEKEEMDFLVDLRNAATKKTKGKGGKPQAAAFNTLYYRALKDYVLADGHIDAQEAHLLRTLILADKRVDPNELRLLGLLKKQAKSTSPEFDELYKECMNMAAKAKPKTSKTKTKTGASKAKTTGKSKAKTTGKSKAKTTKTKKTAKKPAAKK
jgi:uncharacterized tellurite resistance protein B-like protein